MQDPNLDRRIQQLKERITRRHFFAECGVGVGKMALASLLVSAAGKLASQSSTAQASPLSAALGTNPFAPKAPMFPAKAKRVIYLFMAGAPSQLDLLDYKPTLV